VAGEVALSIVLVVAAVLLLRSLDRLQDVDPGFNQAHAVTFTMTLPGPAIRTRPHAIAASSKSNAEYGSNRGSRRSAPPACWRCAASDGRRHDD